MKRQTFFEIAEQAFQKWLRNHSSLRAAALAYFIMLPLPSLFLIAMIILSQVYGFSNSFQTLMQQLTTIVGPTVANLVEQILGTVSSPFTSVITSIVSVAFTFVGAIGAFGVLQDTMNTIWEVKQPKLNFKQKIKRKVAPFFLISFLGLVIMAWTGITTFLLESITYLLVPVVSNAIYALIQVTQLILSFGLATLVFAVMYKYIPETQISWKDVRGAAILTGLIFTVTNYLIGIILETFTVTSVTGAAGAIMILLIWIYLITQLLIYGVAFSKAYSEKMGSNAPEDNETAKTEPPIIPAKSINSGHEN
ncbi:MAG: YihY/virulence factor BrkB family protein [Candidatus Bathyarchaeota archaeon]|nr:MAG: YihY/virulence factor BrkB family protein [Candidatus Bathyarchaeum tardum]WNZ28833.1 MAG: YihY/virulence factor BrkB family protein [Candidatus Bathyarchaeota archaeon]